MECEIKFKGKSAGVWHYGHFFAYKNTGGGTGAHFIIEQNANEKPKPVQVIPDTVGQFTGLCDKNGVKIFEGDLVKVYIPEYWGKDGFFAETEPQEYIGEVKWNIHTLRYEVRFHMDGSGIIGTEFGWSSTDFEVVGNIFDNPELVTKVRPKLFG